MTAVDLRGGWPQPAGLRRLAALFVAPAGRAVDHVAPASVAVLCAQGDATIAGAALGLALLARQGGGCALVCRWPGGAASGAPALPAARRVATRLAARGITATATGRLAVVRLPDDPAEAVIVAGRAVAAAASPSVLVVAGARPPGFDALLGEQDRVVVLPCAEAAEGLDTLAVADAARLARATGLLRLPAGGATRAIASAGLTLPPAVRASAVAALEGPA